MSEQIHIENKEIRGITIKLMYTVIISIIVATTTIVILYASLRESIRQGTLQAINNSTQLNLMQKEMLNDDKERVLWRNTVENQIREQSTRLSIIEERLRIKNPFAKN